MALNLKYSAALKNSRLDAITTAVGTSAKLRIYTGSQPASPDTAISSQTLLVELTCNASAFAAAASGGVLTANAISSGTAVASGTAAWFRLLTSGSVARIDGTVGTSSADCIIDNTSINSSQTVAVTSLTITSGN